MPKISKPVKFDLNSKIYEVISDYDSNRLSQHKFSYKPAVITGIEIKSTPRDNEYKDKTLYETNSGGGDSGWKTEQYLYKTKKECIAFIKQETTDLIAKHKLQDEQYKLNNYNQAKETIKEYELNNQPK